LSNALKPAKRSMPDFHYSPKAIINQIKINLQDRYNSGYPVLKELLQNADDAKAHRFRLDALPGWPTAENPLLRGPGLLVANDGVFRREDERGITSFGESNKAADGAVIGKFGLGQKAVFHLCDAFVVYAYGYGDEPFSTVVNPFLNVEVEGNVSGQWEPPAGRGLAEADLAVLSHELSSGFPRRCLALWLPFRRDGLRPAASVGFSSNLPSASKTITDLAKSDDLKILLTALRHLELIEILENGSVRCAVTIGQTKERLLGPKHDEWDSSTRTFGGTIKSGAVAVPFVGRETMAPGGRLEGLQGTDHWPKTITASLTPQPEKGDPHGAATLLRASKGGPSQLRISWAVFLPISEDSDIVIPVADEELGGICLLLHGYFFLDSGRRQIEGLTEPASDAAPVDYLTLRRAWNWELRDSVVLPLVPALLRDALQSKMMSSAHLGQLVAAIAASTWFENNRRAVCREGALVRVLEKPSAAGGAVWRLIPPGPKLRPLPKSIVEARGRIGDLFPGIEGWAQARNVLLCVDREALTTEEMHWTADDLDTLFALLSQKAFQSGPLAPLLASFLGSIELDEADRRAIGPHLVAALRKAMVETAALAASDHVSTVLKHVPHGLLFSLPTTIEHRQLLRALASAAAAILPVRGEWMSGASSVPLSKADLKGLLGALEPYIDGNTSDQAATAALAMLVRSGQDISQLALDPDFAGIKVLRARDVRGRCLTAVSLHFLAKCAAAGFLFASSPVANRLLPAVVEALPETTPLIVEGKTAEHLQSAVSHLSVRVAQKKEVFALIDRASRFGPDDARARLLDLLPPGDDDNIAALRRLCAGVHGAGDGNAKLWVLEGTPGGIERIVNALLIQSTSHYLVPARIAADLTPRRRKNLGIAQLDAQGLEALLEGNLGSVAPLEPTEQEREEFLLTGLSDDLLRRLPIHVGSDGTIGDAVGAYRDADWPIPAALRAHVRTIEPCTNTGARKTQQRIVPAWSPESQLDVALGLEEPHNFQRVILDAFEQMAAANAEPQPSLKQALCRTPWLAAGGQPIAPEDVLALPLAVDEAAHGLVLKMSVSAPFVPARNLAADIRGHQGFAFLEKWILPDKCSSFEALAMMVEEWKPIGRLGPADGYPVADFTALAAAGADLRLQGWPLLSAALTSLKDQADLALRVSVAFAGADASNPETAARHLDSLAALTEENGPAADAARGAYMHGFAEVAGWPEKARLAVFGAARVPTQGGGWRAGSEVVQDGDGIAPTHMLLQNCAAMLLRKQGGGTTDTHDSGSTSATLNAVRTARPEFKTVDPASLDMQAARQHREFLLRWRGHVPSDLIITYIGLIGRTKPFKDLAEEWRVDATADVETLWSSLDRHFPPSVLIVPLRDVIEQNRFAIEEVAAARVLAMALSGNVFEAPLGATAEGILVGNLHKSPEHVRSADGQWRRSLITLKVQPIDTARSEQCDARRLFRHFVAAVATDCLGLFMSGQQAALQRVLDKTDDVPQAMLEETEHLLRDRLPTVLAELKLPADCRAQQALRIFQHGESRLQRLSASAADDVERLKGLEQLKAELWRAVAHREAADDLLTAVRAKIKDFGYSAGRIMFELFQNADDAYRQQGAAQEGASFRVDIASRAPAGLRVTHWGRPINHLGPDAAEGRRAGYDRDLLNMLLMNFSEKRHGEEATGKFGLGFKSVHLLSDNVGIASGFVALRTVGGFLPAPWPQGPGVSEDLRRLDGRTATVIDIPFSRRATDASAEAVQAFRAALPWLPAFAHATRRVEVTGDDPVTIECSSSPLAGESGIEVVSTSGPERERALRFDLGDRFSLLLRVGTAGPCSFPSRLGRLWNLAPIDELLRSGWLLNGPFPVDPGRIRLAGSHRESIFGSLGRPLGDRLLRLHDLAQSRWAEIANAFGIDASSSAARDLVWTGLFDVFSLDFDDDLAKHLHLERRGYGRLAAERPVVPTRLPQPLGGLVKAGDVEHFTAGVLAEPGALAKVLDWPALGQLAGKIVGYTIANQLSKLGFQRIRPICLADLLRRQMGTTRHVDADLAVKLGSVITPDSIREAPLSRELVELLATARLARFRAQDGSWRVAQLPHAAAADEEERRLCAFAPARFVLDEAYSGRALQFFRVAREQSGFGAAVRDLLAWAAEIPRRDHDRQTAALRYIIEGRQGRELGEAFRRERPKWLPWPASRLRGSDLLSDWLEKEKEDLLYALEGRQAFEPTPVAPAPQADPATVLSSIHAWWVAAGPDLRAAYADRMYPQSFPDLPAQLRDVSERVPWFTMLALACFQTLGRTQDGQHRSFIEGACQDGWWVDLAVSRPPEDARSWLERLERWSAPETPDQSFVPWRRTFVDLYAIARWLDEYIEIVRKLPHIIRDHRVISLNDALRPSYWQPAMKLCIDAAPINRSLGIGINWMLREMVRHGVYESEDEDRMTLYCWAPTQRARTLLNALGANIGTWADKDASRTIHDFIAQHLGVAQATFEGDFDLPLQLITTQKHQKTLAEIFELAGREPPTFDDPDDKDTGPQLGGD
jgi:hypothetical protein